MTEYSEWKNSNINLDECITLKEKFPQEFLIDLICKFREENEKIKKELRERKNV